MKRIETTISLGELEVMSKKMYNNLVKAVVDIDRELMIVDAPLHADQEEIFLEEGAAQESLWGINLHPSKFGTDAFLEFDSMINIRPSQGNPNRDVHDPVVRKKILQIVTKLVTP